MESTEIKKFDYANQDGPKSVYRQSMIEAATSQVQALQDKYTYDPRRNQYVNSVNPNDILSPQEFTDKKNEISTKLDQSLTAKKMPALGVRFNPADAGAGKPSGRAARQQGNQPATARGKTATPQVKAGDSVMVDGKPATVTGINPKTGKPIVKYQ
jgi:uncharacterized Zn-binding protein involved in type VI secretion